MSDQPQNESESEGFFDKVVDAAKDAAEKVGDVIETVVDKVGDAVEAAKDKLGFGDDEAPAASSEEPTDTAA